MHENQEPGRQAFLTRGEVELELARIALVVMRSPPQSYDVVGAAGIEDRDSLPMLCTRLLTSTAPEHRPFVEDRLLELARSLAGGRIDAGYEWLNVTVDLGAGKGPLAR
jgi:hypothetical protein